jgi:hypothetical protein
MMAKITETSFDARAAYENAILTNLVTRIDFRLACACNRERRPELQSSSMNPRQLT